MSFFVKLILILILAFLEARISLPLTIFALTLFTIYGKNSKESSGKVFILGILAGVFLDLLQVRTLGITGALFSLIIFLIFLYKRKFIDKNPVFVVLTIFFPSFVYSYFVYGEMSFALTWALTSSFLVLVFASLFEKNSLSFLAR